MRTINLLSNLFEDFVVELKDPVPIYSAKTNGEAEMLAETLQKAGIEAHIRADESATGFPIGGTTTPLETLQVWVDQSVAERAAEIVNHFEQTRPEREPEQTPGNPAQTFVSAICEECGQSSMFAGTMLGSVQECPHCGKFMDVAAAGDDLEWGDPEDEEQTDHEPDEK